MDREIQLNNENERPDLYCCFLLHFAETSLISPSSSSVMSDCPSSCTG
jgi:hypothetical protein